MVCSQGGLSKLKVLWSLVVFSANVTSNTPVQPSNPPIDFFFIFTKTLFTIYTGT